MTEPLSFLGSAKARLIARIPAALRRQPRIRAVLEAIGAEIEELDEELYQLSIEMRAENATGDALRKIAAIVDEPSAGVDESDLRRLIGARIAANRSEGTRREVAAIWQQLSGEDGRVRDLYPMAVSAQALVDPVPPLRVRRRYGAIMRLAVAATIEFDGVIGSTDSLIVSSVDDSIPALDGPPLATSI